jgi:hypothetical protein
MKNTYLFLTLSFFFFCTACKKEEIIIFQPGDKLNGCVTAKKNGKAFSATLWPNILGENEDELGLLFETFDDEGTLREVFNILVLLEVGVYKTADFKAHDRMIISGYAGHYDEADISYKMDEGKSNRVEVLTIDTITGLVEGTFDIYITKESGGNTGSYPSKISLTDGFFTGTLQ